jgi:hypothetical protein
MRKSLDYTLLTAWMRLHFFRCNQFKQLSASRLMVQPFTHFLENRYAVFAFITRQGGIRVKHEEKTAITIIHKG